MGRDNVASHWSQREVCASSEAVIGKGSQPSLYGPVGTADIRVSDHVRVKKVVEGYMLRLAYRVPRFLPLHPTHRRPTRYSFLYRGMASEQQNLHKDPETGEMVSKSCVN